ncbi:unnamed protein product [Rhizoctonia solani]|uniref:Uncharacterized protein n=1 Tax=Rhizoctonia solani TaxID=456999 RepID=A0A8H3C6H2_9AGAM|nr:unnamed protein product [Rhizoctonia solani]
MTLPVDKSVHVIARSRHRFTPTTSKVAISETVLTSQSKGYKLAYPDVTHPEIYEIYKQSLHKPIHAYGFFVDPVQLFTKRQDRSPAMDELAAKDVLRFLWELREELHATGLHKLAIASIPTPKRYQTSSSGDNGWLVILGTGFDKTLHVPVPEELMRRVREILETEEPPAWWSTRWFNYPHPKLWIEDRKKIMEAQG